jgi:hypothetical protein
VEKQYSGWVTGMVAFAGFMLIMIGVFQAMNGIAALAKDSFYVLGRDYAYEIDITGWGWIHLILGVLVALAGFYVFTGTLWARLIGIFVAVASAVTNFMFVPYYPVWSILIIALNVVVIWALATYRGPEATE